MLRPVEDLVGCSCFNDASGLHHGGAAGDGPDDREIMGDQQEPHAGLALQFRDERENLFLHGHVEGARRFVGDQEFRPVGQRAGNHDALALPAGELVRVGVQAGVGLPETDPLKEAPSLLPGRFAR